MITLGIICDLLLPESSTPSPHCVVDMAHAHATPNSKMEGIIAGASCIPHLRDDIRQSYGSVVIDHADSSNRRYRTVEQKLAVVDVHMSRK